MMWNGHSWGGYRTTGWINLAEKEETTCLFLYSQIFHLHLFKNTAPNILCMFLIVYGIG